MKTCMKEETLKKLEDMGLEVTKYERPTGWRGNHKERQLFMAYFDEKGERVFSLDIERDDLNGDTFMLTNSIEFDNDEWKDCVTVERLAKHILRINVLQYLIETVFPKIRALLTEEEGLKELA